jgi:3'(2'), 5'-bisphosphate nucleotidase
LSLSSIHITPHFTQQLIAIARAAGEAIMVIYNSPEKTNIQLKSDESPVTAADLAAHQVIIDALQTLSPLPIISEEASLPDVVGADVYWLVDPLDGTKEFIARNGEFTVNIALVQNTIPVVGVVHLPVSDETYVGIDANVHENGANFAKKYQYGIEIAELRTRSLQQRKAQKSSFDVLVSHRHGADAASALLDKIQHKWPAPIVPLSAGSSLKFCRIAEGQADFYPRLAPTCCWDTAAAQAVLCAAGGLVIEAESYLPLRARVTPTMLNPFFLALGDANFDWKWLLE